MCHWVATTVIDMLGLKLCGCLYYMVFSQTLDIQWFAAHLEQSAIVKKTITHLWYSCGKPQCTLEFVPYMDMAYGCYIYYAHT